MVSSKKNLPKNAFKNDKVEERINSLKNLLRQQARPQSNS
jgi:hypothetical protein